jgi:hypothetical protein
MAQFLVSEGAGETFPLARADGGSILVQPAVGGGGTGSLPLIFPTIAALSAYNADSPALLATGQQAFVQSNGSWWTLRRGDSTDVADGITIATATSATTSVWTRENISGYLPSAINQSAWSRPLPAENSSSRLEHRSGCKFEGVQ